MGGETADSLSLARLFSARRSQLRWYSLRRPKRGCSSGSRHSTHVERPVIRATPPDYPLSRGEVSRGCPGGSGSERPPSGCGRSGGSRGSTRCCCASCRRGGGARGCPLSPRHGRRGRRGGGCVRVAGAMRGWIRSVRRADGIGGSGARSAGASSRTGTPSGSRRLRQSPLLLRTLATIVRSCQDLRRCVGVRHDVASGKRKGPRPAPHLTFCCSGGSRRHRELRSVPLDRSRVAGVFRGAAHGFTGSFGRARCGKVTHAAARPHR